MSLHEVLPMWVVYKHPRDYPDKWVVRLHLIGRSGVSVPAGAIVADTLEAIRAAIPPGLTCLDRNQADDPVVHEVWL